MGDDFTSRLNVNSLARVYSVSLPAFIFYINIAFLSNNFQVKELIKIKLPNGFGSVSKYSGARRKPWVARVTIGWTDEGKQKFKVIGSYARRAEAIAALTEYNNSPHDFTAKRFTFAQVYKLWAEEYEATGKEINSQYQAAWKRCEPYYDVLYSNLKTTHYQKLINDCEKGYASKKAIKIICNLIAKYALANDIASKNYVELTKLPAPTESRKHTPFSPAELQTLWAGADADIRIQSVLILCYTGLRPTELLKIKKENVDLAERIMRGGSKTAAGKNRVIPIADKIFPFIENAYNRSECEYLIADETHKFPFNYDKYRSQHWNPVMNIFRMAHLPHDGRHTCATNLDNAEVNMKISKLILGHASSDVTEKVYTHKCVEQLLEAINKI